MSPSGSSGPRNEASQVVEYCTVCGGPITQRDVQCGNICNHGGGYAHRSCVQR